MTWPEAFTLAAVILAIPLMLVGMAWADAWGNRRRKEK